MVVGSFSTSWPHLLHLLLGKMEGVYVSNCDVARAELRPKSNIVLVLTLIPPQLLRSVGRYA